MLTSLLRITHLCMCTSLLRITLWGCSHSYDNSHRQEDFPYVGKTPSVWECLLIDWVASICGKAIPYTGIPRCMGLPSQIQWDPSIEKALLYTGALQDMGMTYSKLVCPRIWECIPKSRQVPICISTYIYMYINIYTCTCVYVYIYI
jgi:hypothetical protein